ncbi:hypothetical protein BN14_11617 [Rhizoctonia solani AG-1 IB]|uniref:Uncharacterized protein n=1 Tax=Thanatephorus cucumeris (strain AG1-IB / isolate 7/3/14) TaxID=1108050 RepID=M5CDG6_THACB|nr:hypothetical protein BN14_11617 [Rhizoctonia solani AG-1 IB]
MVTATSLSELRSFWTKYSSFSDLPADELDKFQKEYDSLSKLMSGRAKRGINYDASRSAANSWREAAKPVNEQYAHYWEHGSTFTTSKELKKVTKLNPTFCYSSLGDHFDIDLNTFPRGYHFAPAFTPLVSDPAGPATNSAMAKAKQQFKAGLSAFQASRTENSITLRFFVGDALALCRALDQYAKSRNTDTQEFTSPWRATTIDLGEHAASSPPAPLSFDIIDFASLGSELGLFNALVVGQPLLKKQPASQAVLYTELPMESRTSIYLFHERICHSIATPGLLIGLVPRPYVSLFTSISNTHELTMPRTNPFYMERIAWVDPASGDSHSYDQSNQMVLQVEFRGLMQLIFGLYDTFYSYERLNVDDIAQVLEQEPASIEIFSAIHYTREFVISLLAHTRNRLCLTSEGGWDRLTDFLLQVIPQHTKTSSIDLVHEMGVQCLLHRLPYEKVEAELGEDVARAEVFKDWTEPPARLVCVVLIVPNDKLGDIRKEREGPSPRLICNINDENSGKPTRSTFEAVQAAWGKCVSLEGSDGTYVIEESLSGFQDDSTSDLILSFWANAEKLTPSGLSVSLGLLPTPMAQYDYRKQLGKDLTLFSASITDKNHVLILKDRPTSSSQSQKALRFNVPDPIADNGKLCLISIKGSRDDGSQIREMKARIGVESESDKAALAKGIKGKPKQIGPCTLQVEFRQTQYTFSFPYPILGSLTVIEAHADSHEIIVRYALHLFRHLT